MSIDTLGFMGVFVRSDGLNFLVYYLVVKDFYLLGDMLIASLSNLNPFLSSFLVESFFY